MRVLLVNKFWYPKGGSERYTFLLKDLLEANGHEVVSFGGEDGGVATKPLRALWNRHAARKLDAFLSKARPDVAHLQNFSREISPSILPVLRRHRIPIVWTLHDLDVFRPGYRHPHAWGRRVFAWVEYALHQRILDVYRKHIDVIIAPSRFAADTVRAWGWRGRVEVIPNFVPSPPTPHSSQGKGGNEKKILPLTSGGGGTRPAKPWRSGRGGGVLFVGRLVEEKGILDFLEAAKQLPEVPFEVIGDGPLAVRCQVSGVRCYGVLSPAETAARIASAALVVVPSTIPEIAPYVILEAMTAGVPVVASNIGGVPELVRDGETGVLVPPQDPTALAKTIEMVYRDEVQRRRFGERARAIATAEYGPERHCERIIAIYRELSSS